MSDNPTPIQGEKGDLYCRPTTGLDVCKFFLLNYILHAFTVISEPGAGPIASLFHSALAVFLPFSSVQYSSYVICQSIARCRNDLERAAKARALCFLVPARLRRGEPISPAMTTVHGTFPVLEHVGRMAAPGRSTTPSSARVPEAHETAGQYELVLVPRYAPVEPFLLEESESTARTTDGAVRYRTAVASNSNIMKSAIAMLQIGYGSYELYDAYKGQLQRFGYASYALTVIPYILMSLLNLTASLCQPGYNAMFLVHYRGERDYEHAAGVRERKSPWTSAGVSGPEGEGGESCVELAAVGGVSTGQGGGGGVREPWMVDAESKTAGAVGRVYSLTEDGVRSWLKYHKTLAIKQTLLVLTTSTISFILPYVTIYAMTSFHAAQSTTTERLFTLSQLIIGQLICLFGDHFTGSLSRSGRTRFQLPERTLAVNVPRFLRRYLSCGAESWRVKFAFPIAYRYPSAADLEYIWNLGWRRVCVYVFCSLMAVAPALGGFVVVARMILKDQVCVKL